MPTEEFNQQFNITVTGLVDLKKLQTAYNSLTAAQVKIVAGAATLSGAFTGKLSQQIDTTTNAINSLSQAATKTAKTTSKAGIIASQSFSGITSTAKAVETAVPAITGVTTGTDKATNAFRNITPAAKQATGSILGVTTGFNKAAEATKATKSAIPAITGITTGISEATNAFRNITPAAKQATSGILGITTGFNEAARAAKNNVPAITGITTGANEATNAFRNITPAAKQATGSILGITTGFNTTERAARTTIPAITGITTGTNEATNAFRNITPETARATGGMLGLTTGTRNLDNVTRNTAKTFTALNSLLRITGGVIIGSLVSRAVAALTNAFIGSISAASDFMLRIGEIRTISQNAQLATAQWSEGLRELSDQFATPLLDVAEGAYQALSNQIAEGAETLTFMAEAQRLALISVATTDQAVLALTGTLNAYSLEASHAREVSNAFFKTIELGRLRLEEIAGDIGRVNILGANLGVTYKEVDAALATLTIQGINAAEGMTFLRNVMLKLTRPTTAMRGFFEDIGVTSGQAAIETFGFVGVLRLLAKRAQESNDPMDELGELFGRIRAIIGATGLVTSLDRFESNLKEIENSTKNANAAFDEMRENIGFKFKKELNEVANFFKVELGEKMVKSVVGFSDNILDLSDTISFLTNTIINLGKAALLFIPASALQMIFTWSINTKIAAAATLFWSKAIAFARANVIALTAVAAFFLTDILIKLSKEAKKELDLFNEKYTEKFKEESNKRRLEYEKEIDSMLRKTKEGLSDILAEYSRLINDINKEFEELQEAGEIQKRLIEDITFAQLDLLKAQGKQIQAFTLAQEQLFAVENRLKKLLLDIKEKLLAEEITIFGKEELEATDELFKRLERIQSFIAGLDKIKIDTSGGRAFRRLPERPRRGKDADAFAETDVASSILNLKRLREEISKIPGDFAKATEYEFSRAVTKGLEEVNKELEETARLQEEVNNLTKAGTALNNDAIEKITNLKSAISALAEEFKTPTITRLAEQLSLIGDKPSKENLAALVSLYTKLKEEMISISESVGKLRSGVDPNAGPGAIFGFGTKPVTGLSIEELNKQLQLLDKSFERVSNLVLDASRFNKLLNKFGKENQAALLLEARAIEAQIETLKLNLEGFTNALVTIDENGFRTVEGLQDGVTETIDHYIEVINRAKEELIRINVEILNALSQLQAAQNQPIDTNPLFVPPGTPPIIKQPFAGKFIRRQVGGSVGRDSQLILADPREFIMSAKNTAKFLPQLIAMNSGSRSFESGGPVTNNNIGDINVNVTASGKNIDARELGIALRRELRRNTVRLN
jgi:TP901 family phage tail tape measure protein